MTSRHKKTVVILKITSSGLNFTQYGTFLFVNLPKHWPRKVKNTSWFHVVHCEKKERWPYQFRCPKACSICHMLHSEMSNRHCWNIYLEQLYYDLKWIKTRLLFSMFLTLGWAYRVDAALPCKGSPLSSIILKPHMKVQPRLEPRPPSLGRELWPQHNTRWLDFVQSGVL